MTAQGFHQNSARSVWVPLSVVPQPQYGNGTVWQDAGLRTATRLRGCKCGSGLVNSG